MTTEQINALQPGPECDRLVAEAIGKLVPVDEQRIRADFRFSLKIDGVIQFARLAQFRPSTDWNDAMFAAERFGLFRPGHHERIMYQTGGMNEPDRVWAIADDHGDGYVDDARAPTGPLAICSAILAINQQR